MGAKIVEIVMLAVIVSVLAWCIEKLKKKRDKGSSIDKKSDVKKPKRN